MSFAKPFAVAACLLIGATAVAQSPLRDDSPRPHVPRQPATQHELDHAEALKHYALGVLHERDSRFLDAIKDYEAALRLDPDATPLYKAVIPLYFAVDRTEDAFAACQRALTLDPGDFDIAYLYGRQLKKQERTRDAIAVLQKASQAPRLKDRPDVHAQILFDLGLFEEEADHLAEAEKAFTGVVELLDNPDALLEHGPFNREDIVAQCADTWERLGRVRLRLNQPAAAIPAFQQAGKKDPTRAPRLAYNLAEVYAQSDKPEAALAQVNIYLRLLPSGMDAYELKIRLLKKLNREREILPGVRDAAERDPHNVSLQLLLGREYRNAGQADAALRLYRELARQQPTPEVYKALLDLYRDDGAKGGARALELLNQLVTAASPLDKKGNMAPGDETAAAQARAVLAVLRDDPALVKRMLDAAHRALLGGQELSHQTRMLLGFLASRTRQLDAAEELYRSCLRQPLAPDLEHEVYSGLLRVLEQAHKYEDVVKVCNQGLEKAKATSRVLFHIDLATAQMALEHPREALAAANAAVDESSDADRLLCRRIRVDILSESDKHDEAIAECQALLKEYNQTEEVRAIRASLAMAYSAAKKYDDSEQELQRILEADANDATANNDLGYQWADRGKNLPEAEKLIRKALALDKQQRNAGTTVGLDADQDNAAYVDSLGWVLFRRGKLDDARKELERATALPAGVEDPTVWDHLGDVYFRLELKAKASAAWQKSLKLYDQGRRRRTDGRYDDIKKKLKLLEQ